MDLIQKAQELADSLNTVEELAKARDSLRSPFNKKIAAIQKAEREEKRRIREEAAEKLCLALKPGEKVVMLVHGFLNIFDPTDGTDRFYKPDATVYVYQPRKRILWLDCTLSKGKKHCRPFSLSDVASYKVRRKVE
jgi:hypothetical protein